MELESLDGKMEESMKVNGQEESNTELVFIEMGKVKKDKESGMMVKEFNGLTDEILKPYYDSLIFVTLIYFLIFS